MDYFQTKNPDLGKFWRVLQQRVLVYFVVIGQIFRTFGMFGGHLGYFVVIWSIFAILVCCTKKNLATLLCCGKLSM
jgi:cellulose synthase/poly-beta-1,6-N-acetylglucosamine synthase-like glycosyltransferase